MSLVQSKMLALGTQAPSFSLPDTSGSLVRLDDLKAVEALLVMFICNHCPFVVHASAQIASIARDYRHRSVGLVAINSNDPSVYPEDHPSLMAREQERRGYTFPYLYDESQAVARSYDAACTPDFFLFGSERRLYYRGRLDSTRPTRPGPDGHPPADAPVADGVELRGALERLLAGGPPPQPQHPSIGCSIKWRSTGSNPGANLANQGDAADGAE